jgi:sulfate permease, SulP family
MAARENHERLFPRTADRRGQGWCRWWRCAAGHFRFGGRTATAPVLIGLIFVLLGIGFGESGHAMLKTIPDAVLGGLLLFSGIELALSSKLHEHQGADLFLVLLMAAIGIAWNPAVAFAVGLPIAYASKRKWLRI